MQSRVVRKKEKKNHRQLPGNIGSNKVAFLCKSRGRERESLLMRDDDVDECIISIKNIKGERDEVS